jgi:hypothetical protein
VTVRLPIAGANAAAPRADNDQRRYRAGGAPAPVRCANAG